MVVGVVEARLSQHHSNSSFEANTWAFGPKKEVVGSIRRVCYDHTYVVTSQRLVNALHSLEICCLGV